MSQNRNTTLPSTPLRDRHLVWALVALLVGALVSDVDAQVTLNLHVTSPDAGRAPSPLLIGETPDVEAAVADSADSAPIPTETTVTEAAEVEVEAVEGETSQDIQVEVVETAPPPANQAEQTATATLSVPADIPAREPRRLSVEPNLKSLLPPDYPAWIVSEPDYSPSVHLWPVGSLPTNAESELDGALKEPLLASVREYVDRVVVKEPGAYAQISALVDDAYIRLNLINDLEGYTAELETGGEPMYRKWVSVSTTPAQRLQILNWYKQSVQRERLGALATSLITCLALVGLIHLALRSWRGAPKLASLGGGHPAEEAAHPSHHSRKRRSLFPLAILLCIFVLPALVLLSFVSLKVHREGVPVHAERLHDVAPSVPAPPEVFAPEPDVSTMIPLPPSPPQAVTWTASSPPVHTRHPAPNYHHVSVTSSTPTTAPLHFIEGEVQMEHVPVAPAMQHTSSVRMNQLAWGPVILLVIGASAVGLTAFIWSRR